MLKRTKKPSTSTVNDFESLSRVAQVFLTTVDFTKLVQKVVDSVLDEVATLGHGYHVALLALISKEKGKKVLKRIAISQTKEAEHIQGASETLFKDIVTPLTAKKNHCIRVMEERQHLLTHSFVDVLNPPFSIEKCNRLQKAGEIKTTISFPVIVKDEPIGMIIFSTKQHIKKLTKREVRFISSLNNIIGIAVENAALFKQIEKDKLELEEANHDLKHANCELRHLDKLKDEFVFIATHELKTPVTVMKGYLSMINDGNYGDPPQPLKEPLSEIQSANQQLVQLVGDLLEIARSEAKRLDIQTQPTKICEIGDQVINNLKSLANKKGLKLTHDCQKIMDTQVMGDPDKLREVLNNLISNAIKYSESGTISITHASDDGKLIIHVKDQGYGISKKDQKKIFSKFFRADEVAGKAPGTGLGLFIVKQLIEKMGGKIWFSSKLGEGTTFSLSLPLATDQDIQNHQAQQIKEAPPPDSPQKDI